MSEDLNLSFTDDVLGAKKFVELTDRRPPQSLFHYTGQYGLLGILTTAELWATKVQYMNDSTEFGLAVDLANAILNQRLLETEDENEKKLFKNIISHLAGISNINICSISFCADPDLLSQWRGYSGSDSGFSIGFKSDFLSRTARGYGARLGHCIYDPEQQKTIINEMIDAAILKIVQIDSLPEISIPTVADNFRMTLIKFGAFFKDKSFIEEGEWRLVTSVKHYDDENLNFRQGKSTLIPYYKIPIRHIDQAITKVTIGPCPHPKISNEAVLGLLMKHNISEGYAGSAVNSKIPFRNW